MPLPSSASLSAKALREEPETGAAQPSRTEEESVVDPFYPTAEPVGACERKGVLPSHARLRSCPVRFLFPGRLLAAVTPEVSLVLS